MLKKHLIFTNRFLVANLQTQAIPEESNKPNIDYRKEEITISSSLQYVIVNGTNTSPSWTSAKMGSGSGISITDIISSDHESTVYYRYAASNKDKKFAAGCSREVIERGAEMLGWDLDTLIERTILAMRASSHVD